MQHFLCLTCSNSPAGGLAGAISRTATAPIDRLRMLQQVNSSRSLLSMRKVRPEEGICCLSGEHTTLCYIASSASESIRCGVYHLPTPMPAAAKSIACCLPSQASK
jgi:hypothetical protein